MTQEQTLNNRIWVFVAYKGDVPYFSKLFNNHEELKEFSATHSKAEKGNVENYSSTYFDLTDKSFLSIQRQQILEAVEKRLMHCRDCRENYDPAIDSECDCCKREVIEIIKNHEPML